MIDPNNHYGPVKGTIKTAHGSAGLYTVYTKQGGDYLGYDLPKRFKLGDNVTIKLRYSITLDRFSIVSIRKRNKV